MTVFFFQRKPIVDKNFSIEILFNSIRKHLPPTIQHRVVLSRFVNSGGLQKIGNIVEILFKKQGDINHITGDVHYIALLMKKQKTILTIHDLNLLSSPSPLKRGVHRWFWLKMPIWRSQVVTAISQTTKDEVLRQTGCAPAKVRVIYNCISSDFSPHPAAFNHQKPTILQIGTKPNKNLARVAEALHNIPCRLRIIGKPTETDLALLKKYQIDVKWQAGITDEEVVQHYIECDMLVFVSTLEGFGLPIIEANTVERPVVTSNISSMPEIAGDSACLVDPYDVAAIRKGILRVIQDGDYREHLLERGRANRQRFTPETVAEAYAQLYTEVYQSGR